MEALLVEKDPLVRDLVKVGLQQCPDFQVTVGRGYAGIDELRSRHFDCVFVGVDPAQKGALKLLQHLRSFDSTTELIVIAPAAAIRDLAAEKTKYGIHSFLTAPIDPREFFGLLGRFLERRTDRPASTLRKGPRSAKASARR